VPAFWALLGGVLCVFAPIAVRGGPALQPLAPVAAWGGVGLLAGGVLLLAERRQRRRAGAALLIAGLWGALLALFSGPLWLWELNETWPVRPIGQELRQRPEGAVQLWREAERPSLNWYAGQRVRPKDDEAGGGATPSSRPWLLLSLEDSAPAPRGLLCVPLHPARPARTAVSPPAPVPRLFRCTAGLSGNALGAREAANGENLKN
jgi:hypothetical protein